MSAEPLCRQNAEAAQSSADPQARLRSAAVVPKSGAVRRLRPSNAEVQARKSVLVARRSGAVLVWRRSLAAARRGEQAPARRNNMASRAAAPDNRTVPVRANGSSSSLRSYSSRIEMAWM